MEGALADAYGGRARDLAAKGMFKEAAMVLENTLAADGTVTGYRGCTCQCLIRDGQQQKAAVVLAQRPTREGELPTGERAASRRSRRHCW